EEIAMIFADTFYYVALLNPNDRAHGRAVAATASLTSKLLTTAWVLTELADAFPSIRLRLRCWNSIHTVLSDPDTQVVPMDQTLFDAGLALYGARLDKEWSLTDCISFVVMQREGIIEALTGDHHFEQAGFVALLK